VTPAASMPVVVLMAGDPTPAAEAAMRARPSPQYEPDRVRV